MRAAIIAAAIIAAALVAVGCVPVHTDTAPPTIGEWSTIVAPAGLTPSHVGACVDGIDTNTAARIVADYNAAHRSYGPLPQAGDIYWVPTSTVDCLEGDA